MGIMQIPRFPDDPCLLISDAGLGSLVLAAMASEQSCKDLTRIYPAWWTSQTDMDIRIPAIDRAIQMQGDLLSLQVIADHAGYPEDATPRSAQSSIGTHQTRMLLDAATLAMQLGLKRVVWPIRAIGPSRSENSEELIYHIGVAIDRALLTARLATLDAQEHGGVEVTIETPIVDLTNHELSDLAADLNVPINACWWTDTSLPDAAEHFNCWDHEPTTASMLEHRPSSASSALNT